MNSDTLGDTLTRIRNASMVHKKTVTVPNTKLNIAVLKVIEQAGYIQSFEIVEGESFNEIVVKLKYVNGKSAISHIKRISKPGVRIYTKIADFCRVLSGLGLGIISSSKGVLSDKEARIKKIGGEVLAELW